MRLQQRSLLIRRMHCVSKTVVDTTSLFVFALFINMHPCSSSRANPDDRSFASLALQTQLPPPTSHIESSTSQKAKFAVD